MLHTPTNIIIAGDLNVTLAPCEKKGGVRGKDYMHDVVENMIHDWDFVDIKPKVGRFTWLNQRVGAESIFARLDRFLVQGTLLDNKWMISSKILPKLASYHHLISLQFEIEDELGPIHFRFCPLWIEHEGFMDMVSQAWSKFVNGSPSYV